MSEFFADAEFKFSSENEAKGIFEGYGAVFGNVDSHRDIIAPGAFKETLEEKKASGRSVPMHVMHRVYGGDGLPVGVFKKLEEDSTGLRVIGKISGINTDAGKLLFERVKDGAFGGLSIGYGIKPNGSVAGKKGEAHARMLTNLDLKEISLVDSPSNAMSRVDSFKSEMLTELKELMKLTDVNKSSSAVAAAIALHAKTLSGGNSPTAEQRQELLNSLCDAHEALTGQRMPEGMKTAPTTVREFEALLRDGLGFSHAMARSIAEGGFKNLSSDHRDDDEAKAAKEKEETEAKAALSLLLPSSK